MTLKKLREYLNRMAHLSPKDLDKEFAVRDVSTNNLYEVSMVDEGAKLAEILINTNGNTSPNAGWDAAHSEAAQS